MRFENSQPIQIKQVLEQIAEEDNTSSNSSKSSDKESNDEEKKMEDIELDNSVKQFFEATKK